MVLFLLEAEAGFDFMRSIFTPAKDLGREDAAGNEENYDEGEGPAFAWESVRDVNDMLGQDAKEENVKNAQEIDGVESGGNGKCDADPGMVFQSPVKDEIFSTIAKRSGQSDEREAANKEERR